MTFDFEPTPEDRKIYVTAQEILEDAGMSFSAPWQGDLDDEERERYDALQAALRAVAPLILAQAGGRVQVTPAMVCALHGVDPKGDWRHLIEKWTPMIERMLAATPILAQASGREGWKMVPVEPTEAMFKAMMEANIHPPQNKDGSISVQGQNEYIWDAALAAAPLPDPPAGERG